jgi:hypothetical protein
MDLLITLKQAFFSAFPVQTLHPPPAPKPFLFPCGEYHALVCYEAQYNTYNGHKSGRPPPPPPGGTSFLTPFPHIAASGEVGGHV